MDKSDEDTEWEKEMGVVIDLAKESDYPEIQAVVHSHFYMEEPTQYSMEMGTGTGVFDRYNSTVLFRVLSLSKRKKMMKYQRQNNLPMPFSSTESGNGCATII